MKDWVGLVGWPTADGLSGHPSDAGRAQDRESSPVKDQRSTTVPRNQTIYNFIYGSQETEIK